jgi:hypothetical protein
LLPSIQDWETLFPGSMFLPTGKGALILLVGGMLIVGASLMWRSWSRPAPRPTRRTPVVGRPVSQGPAAVSLAARLGTLTTDPGGPMERIEPYGSRSLVITLRACRPLRASGALHCERERTTLQAQLHSLQLSAHVRELGCADFGEPQCRFVVEPRPA